MKKLGGHRIFSREIGGSQKKQEIFGWLQNFSENFVQWNSPKNAYFLRYAQKGVTCFFNIVALEGGHRIFDHQIGGSQKYCWGTFGNSWPPYSKENRGPLMHFQDMNQCWCCVLQNFWVATNFDDCSVIRRLCSLKIRICSPTWYEP